MAEDLTNSFTIPKAAPSGEAVFSWTWFNRLGNREMYQVSLGSRLFHGFQRG